MADLNKDQKLDPHEFVIAMFLIANRKRGFELPPVVPDSLIASAWPDPSSPTQPSLPPSNPALSTPAVRLLHPPPLPRVLFSCPFSPPLVLRVPSRSLLTLSLFCLLFTQFPRLL